jgi:hypothetical protein
MKQTLSDTVILWFLLAVLAFIHGAAATGVELPLLERTTLWRLGMNPAISVGIAAVVIVTTVILGPGGQNRRTKALFIAGLYGGLALVCLIAFDIGVGLAFLTISVGMYRRYRAETHNMEFNTDAEARGLTDR